jgi:hypothetical protein
LNYNKRGLRQLIKRICIGDIERMALALYMMGGQAFTPLLAQGQFPTCSEDPQLFFPSTPDMNYLGEDRGGKRVGDGNDGFIQIIIGVRQVICLVSILIETHR